MKAYPTPRNRRPIPNSFLLRASFSILPTATWVFNFPHFHFYHKKKEKRTLTSRISCSWSLLLVEISLGPLKMLSWAKKEEICLGFCKLNLIFCFLLWILCLSSSFIWNISEISYVFYCFIISNVFSFIDNMCLLQSHLITYVMSKKLVQNSYIVYCLLFPMCCLSSIICAFFSRIWLHSACDI